MEESVVEAVGVSVEDSVEEPDPVVVSGVVVEIVLASVVVVSASGDVSVLAVVVSASGEVSVLVVVVGDSVDEVGDVDPGNSELVVEIGESVVVTVVEAVVGPSRSQLTSSAVSRSSQASPMHW